MAVGGCGLGIQKGWGVGGGWKVAAGVRSGTCGVGAWWVGLWMDGRIEKKKQ